MSTRRHRAAAAIAEEAERQLGYSLGADHQALPIVGRLDAVALAEVALAAGRDESHFTPALLRKRLQFEPIIGELLWRDYPEDEEWSRVYAGRVADVPRADGYRILRLDGVQLLSHRVIIAMITGSWPVSEVGHVDGDRGNNRPENLVPRSRGQSVQAAWGEAGSSGLRGVMKNGNRWRASIYVDGRRRELGMFVSPEEAALAYDKAAVDYFGPNAMTNGHSL